MLFPPGFPQSSETPTEVSACQKWQRPSKRLSSMQPDSGARELRATSQGALCHYFWPLKQVTFFLMCVHEILLLYQMKKLQTLLVAFPQTVFLFRNILWNEPVILTQESKGFKIPALRYMWKSNPNDPKRTPKTHKFWQDFGISGNLIHFWWDWKMVQPLWNTVW